MGDLLHLVEDLCRFLLVFIGVYHAWLRFLRRRHACGYNGHAACAVLTGISLKVSEACERYACSESVLLYSLPVKREAHLVPGLAYPSVALHQTTIFSVFSTVSPPYVRLQFPLY